MIKPKKHRSIRNRQELPPAATPIPRRILPNLPIPVEESPKGTGTFKAQGFTVRPLGYLCFLLLTCSLFVTACQSLTYTNPSGERFTRTSIGTKTAISSLSVETDTNGIRRVELQGYTNDQTQAISTITEAAIRAALTAK